MSSATWKLRSDQMQMRARMTRSLSRLWPTLDFDRLDATYPGWAFSVEQMVRHYEQESMDRALEYLDTLYAQRGVTRPTVELPTIPAEQIDAALHSKSVAALKSATRVGKRYETALSSSFAASSQAMVRLVRDSSRDTIRVTSLADDTFGGWRRIGTGTTCAFCTMLISRDAVYTEGSVRFASHDNCNCEVEPADQSLRRDVDTYRQSDRTSKFDTEQKQADKERVQQWLSVNLVG